MGHDLETDREGGNESTAMVLDYTDKSRCRSTEYKKLLMTRTPI